MTDRDLLEHILEAASRLSDSIIFECSQATEWLEGPAVRRIAGDAQDIQTAVEFIKKRMEVSNE